MVIVTFVCVVYRYFLIGKRKPRLGFLAVVMDDGVLAHYKIISPKVQKGEMGRLTGMRAPTG